MTQFLLLLQETATSQMFGASPTTIAAFVALLGVILAPFINSYLQNRRTEREKREGETGQRLLIGRDERKEAIELLKATHARDLAIFKRQMREQDLRTDRLIIDAKVLEYEGRQRAHMYGNECNRSVSAVYRRDAALAQHGIEDVPPFVFKSYSEIMDGLDEKIAEYRRQLEQEFAARRREDEEAEAAGEHSTLG